MHTPLKIAPPAASTMTSMEKILFAFLGLPSPSVLAMSALPPVPIIKPTAASAMMTGKMRFSAANEFLPTKFETKKPSTML